MVQRIADGSHKGSTGHSCVPIRRFFPFVAFFLPTHVQDADSVGISHIGVYLDNNTKIKKKMLIILMPKAITFIAQMIKPSVYHSSIYFHEPVFLFVVLYFITRLLGYVIFGLSAVQQMGHFMEIVTFSKLKSGYFLTLFSANFLPFNLN